MTLSNAAMFKFVERLIMQTYIFGFKTNQRVKGQNKRKQTRIINRIVSEWVISIFNKALPFINFFKRVKW